MKVYIVQHCEANEGCSIYGIFSSQEKAQQYLSSLQKDGFYDEVDIAEYEVDKEVI